MRLDTLRRVETPEGIALTLRTAGAVPRALAFLVDLLIRLCIFFVCAMVLGMVQGLGFGLLLVAAFALEWFYPVLFELSRSAATPGKRALGLRVVMDDGMPVTLAASLLRNLLRVVDFLPALYLTGVLSMLWRADFKRLGDVVAGTLVVHDRDVSLHGSPPPAEPMAPAVPLTAAQQTAIVDWALRAPRLTAARAEELAALAAPALADGPGTPGQRLLALAHWALGRR
jgi:uncharacterized RDD family membrane protein YckC